MSPFRESGPEACLEGKVGRLYDVERWIAAGKPPDILVGNSAVVRIRRRWDLGLSASSRRSRERAGRFVNLEQRRQSYVVAKAGNWPAPTSFCSTKKSHH
jgi:hypothetical protein